MRHLTIVPANRPESDPDESTLNRDSHSVRAISRAQFACDRRDVKLHRLVADRQACGNRPIWQAFSDKFQDLGLARGERLDVFGRRVARRRWARADDERLHVSGDRPSGGERGRLTDDVERRVRQRLSKALAVSRAADQHDAHSAMRPVAHNHRQFERRAAANDAHGNRPSNAIAVEQFEEIHGRRHRLAVEGDDHVADENTSGLRRTAGRDADHERRVRTIGGLAIALRQQDGLSRDAEEAPLRRAVFGEGRRARPDNVGGNDDARSRMTAAVVRPIIVPDMSTNAPPENPPCIVASVRMTRSIDWP